MTREEAVLILTRLEKGCDEYAGLTNYAKEALQMAITALSAETDGDVISRQAAIDALKPLPTIEGLSLQPLITVDDVIKVLNGLPPAQPEIIRCKDCIRYHEPSCLMAYDGKEWSEDDGFCHVAERRTDGVYC